MLALALGPLLDNMRLLDLGRALRLLDLVASVMRRTVEGQGLELTWIAEHRWDITRDEYVEMVTLKTAWYSFAGPLIAGAIVAEAAPALISELTAFAIHLGVAFQIRDDTLNLLAEPVATGKESWGDLWEGKRTLILSLFFAAAPVDEVALARDILRQHRQDKTAAEIVRLRALVDPYIASADQIAADFAARAAELWAGIRPAMAPSIHCDLIESILAFTVARDR
jgi:geranylgeranyl pyrophosphate synthase